MLILDGDLPMAPIAMSHRRDDTLPLDEMRRRGRECTPDGIDSIVDYHKLGDILRARGASLQDVENIMWRNWVRLFDRTLPER